MIRRFVLWTGITMADIRESLAVGITVGLMLAGAAVVLMPVVAILRWLLE